MEKNKILKTTFACVCLAVAVWIAVAVTVAAVKIPNKKTKPDAQIVKLETGWVSSSGTPVGEFEGYMYVDVCIQNNTQKPLNVNITAYVGDDTITQTFFIEPQPKDKNTSIIYIPCRIVSTKYKTQSSKNYATINSIDVLIDYMEK